jgi:hypothetical protein
VINNKTTWVRVKSTGGKTYLSKKYKVSLKNTKSKSKEVLLTLSQNENKSGINHVKLNKS